MKKLLASLALVIVATLGLAACSAPSTAPEAMKAGTVVVDVRTPGEYAQGHLTGAVNMDVESPAFDGQVTQLPTDGTYVVYCHSGTRAAAAVSRMTAMGFSHLTNAGGISDASASTGLAIVTTP
jgi:rhodanese-related sulfurtransferase